jgi:hypothetical protein
LSAALTCSPPRHSIGGRKADLDVLRMSGPSFEREQRDNIGG